MSTALTKRYNSYYFGLSSNLTDQQLTLLIRLFNMPTSAADSVLGGRSSVAVADIEGLGSVVVKYYTRGGLVRHVLKRTYLRCGKTRCQIEYDLLEKLRGLRVNAPQPIAYAYQGRLFYKGWLVTREIKQQKTLAELSCANEDHAHMAMKDLIDQVSTLIENNIFHVDLHPGNVLVDRGGRVFLLDFDRACISRRNKNTLRNHYLSRWRRAVIKHGLPETLSEMLSAGLDRDYELK